MAFEIDKPLIDEMVNAYAQRKAGDLKARIDAKGIRTEMDGLNIVAPDPDAMLKEYGTATVAPDPWGITSLMEMDGG